jgi:hypothetical protein
MKKSFTFFAVLLLFAGCGQLADKMKDNLKMALQLKSEFEAGSVEMSSSMVNNSQSLEVNLTNATLAGSLGYQAEFVATAVAVEAYKLDGKSVNSVKVNMLSDTTDYSLTYDKKQLDSYTMSEASAESYLMALCDKDKSSMLKLGDPDYLGESSIEDAIGIAKSKLQSKEHIANVQIIRILDSNIDDTVIPIHIICYKVTYKSGASNICDMYVRCDKDTDHKVSGFNIR